MPELPAPSSILRSRNWILRTPQPTVPLGLSTGPASTPKLLLSSPPCQHPKSDSFWPSALMLSSEGKSGRWQPEPASLGTAMSLPGACLQLACANQQRSQWLTLLLHVAPSWPISQQHEVSSSHRCGCAIKCLKWKQLQEQTI